MHDVIAKWTWYSNGRLEGFGFHHVVYEEYDLLRLPIMSMGTR